MCLVLLDLFIKGPVENHLIEPIVWLKFCVGICFFLYFVRIDPIYPISAVNTLNTVPASAIMPEKKQFKPRWLCQKNAVTKLFSVRRGHIKVNLSNTSAADFTVALDQLDIWRHAHIKEW